MTDVLDRAPAKTLSKTLRQLAQSEARVGELEYALERIERKTIMDGVTAISMRAIAKAALR